MLNVLLLFASCLFFSMNRNVEANTQCSVAPTDIIFLVDDSGSLKDADFQKELLFVNHLISFFDLSPSSYQVGVTTFSTDVRTYLKLGSTSNKNQIYSTVSKISPSRGMTFLGKALQHIIREGFSASGGSRNGARKVLIIVTDGDTIDLQDTITASMLLKGLKVNIFVIGIGTHLNQANLQRIVSHPEDLFQTKTFDELPKIAQSLKQVVCKKPTNCKTQPADIIFALDTSDSVVDADFDKMLIFVKKFILSSNIDKDIIRTGVFTFADQPQMQISLTSYYDKMKLLMAIGNIRRNYGMTNTDKVLKAVTLYWFQTLQGSRPKSVRKILIVITDGVSVRPDATAAAARDLHTLGVEVFTVGVGKSVSYSELLVMAGKKENVFSISRFDALSKIAQKVFQVVCEKKEHPVISCSETPTDVIFLVDDSGSLKDADFQKELLFVNHLISFFDLSPNSYQVGVTTFSTDVRTYLKLGSTSNKNQIYSTVSKISPSRGMTFLGKALQHIIREGFSASGGSRNGARKVLIIVTDGDTIDLQDTITASMLLKGLKVNIFVIGIGTHLNQANLQRIVSHPEDLFQTKTFDELPKIAQSLKQVVCKKPTIPTCTKCSMPPTDLMFLIDDSDSLKPTDFQKELFFVNHLISFFDLSPDHYQVGVSTFSTDLHTFLEIGTSNDKNQIKSVISRIKASKGMTFLGKALGNIVNKAFAGGKSRNGVRKVLVVITDGDTVDTDWTLKMAQNLRLLKIELFAIGIGSHLNMDYLQRIVTTPQNLFQVQNFNTLNLVSNSVRKAVCKETTDCTVFE